MLMVDVRWQVYWITFVCVGGYAVIMACCRSWSPYVSVCSPQIRCDRMCFVTSVPLLFASVQFSGSVVIIWYSVARPIYRDSINRGMSSVLGGLCAKGCVCAGYMDG